jgi:predicted transcriptional regulator
VTKQEIALKLLKHGPLTASQFWEITGWKRATAYQALYRLTEMGEVKTARRRVGKKLYFV